MWFQGRVTKRILKLHVPLLEKKTLQKWMQDSLRIDVGAASMSACSEGVENASTVAAVILIPVWSGTTLAESGLTASEELHIMDAQKTAGQPAVFVLGVQAVEGKTVEIMMKERRGIHPRCLSSLCFA